MFTDSSVPGGAMPTQGVAWPLNAIFTTSWRSMP